jgi:hypothetical protein
MKVMNNNTGLQPKNCIGFFTVSYRFLLTETGESSKNIPSRQFFLQNSYF